MQLGPVMDMSKAGSIKCFEEAQARIMFRQLVLAVEFIHAQGIIHRDIKPSNLLLYACPGHSARCVPRPIICVCGC